MPREAFNFSEAMHSLCSDICERHAEFRHIDMERIPVTYSQARSDRLAGRQAFLIPLRFPGGKRFEDRDGHTWTAEQIRFRGTDALYVLTFLLPRFLNLSFREKLITVFHELYHISPSFDGDLRRFSGRFALHDRSCVEYDRRMAEFAEEYLAKQPPPLYLRFLRADYSELTRAHGGVVGIMLRRPRIYRAA